MRSAIFHVDPIEDKRKADEASTDRGGKKPRSGFPFGSAGPVVKKEKAKVLIVGVDHGGWEDYFNAHIEEIWQPNFFMYNEGHNPALYYKKKDIEGFGEDNIWGALELALSGVIAITNGDMGTIMSRMAVHGFRPRDYPSLNSLGLITLALNDRNLELYWIDDQLYEYEEKHGLSHCGSKRLAGIYADMDNFKTSRMVKELVDYTDEQLMREFKLQRHTFALGIMILIETIGNADTRFARLVKKQFGGVDFTEFDVDLSWRDLYKFDAFTEDVRDKWVFEELELVFLGDKYDAYVLVMGSAHVPHFHEVLRSRDEPFMYLDMARGIESKVVSLSGLYHYEDMDEARGKIVEAMNEISEFLIGVGIRRSTRFINL